MSLYDVFITYIVPLFVDLQKFPHGEAVFYYAFEALTLGIVLYICVCLPFKFLLWLTSSKRNNNRFLR
jgi:hypothetical protein